MTIRWNVPTRQHPRRASSNSSRLFQQLQTKQKPRKIELSIDAATGATMEPRIVVGWSAPTSRVADLAIVSIAGPSRRFSVAGLAITAPLAAMTALLCAGLLERTEKFRFRPKVDHVALDLGAAGCFRAWLVISIRTARGLWRDEASELTSLRHRRRYARVAAAAKALLVKRVRFVVGFRGWSATGSDGAPVAAF